MRIEDLPNMIFIVGAPRCGTTTLSDWLRKHPDICFPFVKEPHFFAQYDLTEMDDTAARELSQREFVDRLDLPFDVLSDPALSLAAALDLPTFEAGGLTLYRRLTLIVREGAVEHAFYPVFPPNEHAGEVLDWLRHNPS